MLDTNICSWSAYLIYKYTKNGLKTNQKKKKTKLLIEHLIFMSLIIDCLVVGSRFSTWAIWPKKIWPCDVANDGVLNAKRGKYSISILHLWITSENRTGKVPHPSRYHLYHFFIKCFGIILHPPSVSNIDFDFAYFAFYPDCCPYDRQIDFGNKFCTIELQFTG